MCVIQQKIMHEMFLIDIYNDLGLSYNISTDDKRNLYQVYINIYDPHLSDDRTDAIIDLLKYFASKISLAVSTTLEKDTT